MHESDRGIKRVFLRWIIPTCIIIGLWQITALVVGKDFLVPYPLTVLVRLCELVFTINFWTTIASTLHRITIGFLLGITSGAVIAWFMFVSKIAFYVISPIMKILKTVPVVSFVLILLLWLDSAVLPIAVAAIMVAPVSWANISAGLGEIKMEYLDMARVFQLSLSARLKAIYFPSLVPYFRSAIAAGVGLAWKSGVTAEVLALPILAIGSKLYSAKIYLESPDIFAWTIVIIVLSVLFEKIITIGSKKLLSGSDVRD